MGLLVVRADITKISRTTKRKTDAIVNSANPKPRYLNGVDRAIYEAAGEDLLEERIKKGAMDEGEVLITRPYNLSNIAKIIIHVVVPKWDCNDELILKKLRNCYVNVLEAAIEYPLSIESVTFPLLGTGVNGFPIIDAFKVAEDVAREYIEAKKIKEIIICVFDRLAYRKIEDIHGGIAIFIEDEEVEEVAQCEYKKIDENGNVLRLPNAYEELGIKEKDNVNEKQTTNRLKYDYSGAVKLDFWTKWDQYYKELKISNQTDEYIAEKCCISRKTLNAWYKKSVQRIERDMVLRFCFGFGLNRENAESLLKSAGHSLNEKDKRDAIIIKHLNHEQKNNHNRLIDLNIELSDNNLALLEKQTKHTSPKYEQYCQ